MSSVAAGDVLTHRNGVTCSEQAFGTLLVLQSVQKLTHFWTETLTALTCLSSLKVLTLICAEVDEA